MLSMADCSKTLLLFRATGRAAPPRMGFTIQTGHPLEANPAIRVHYIGSTFSVNDVFLFLVGIFPSDPGYEFRRETPGE